MISDRLVVVDARIIIYYKHLGSIGKKKEAEIFGRKKKPNIFELLVILFVGKHRKILHGPYPHFSFMSLLSLHPNHIV